MKSAITVIVPRLPPSVDGVGDYSLNLALALDDRYNLTSNFIVGDPNWQREENLENFNVNQVSERKTLELIKLLDSFSPNIILLHYVGHGYANRGCPTWLVQGLEHWRKGQKDRFLITMFHETYAKGAMGKSSFFTSPFQKHLFEQLVLLSDRCITNRQNNAEIICAASKGKHTQVTAVPVFSNVGEPENHLPLAQRQKRLVIFGSGYYRAMSYQNSQDALQLACRNLEIEEIIDIGIPLKFDILPISGIPVSCLGVKSASEVSSVLANARVGFLDYPPDYLCRSTIFSAYCAHALLPVLGLSFVDRKCESTLESGKHFYFPKGKINLDNAQAIADSSWH